MKQTQFPNMLNDMITISKKILAEIEKSIKLTEESPIYANSFVAAWPEYFLQMSHNPITDKWGYSNDMGNPYTFEHKADAVKICQQFSNGHGIHPVVYTTPEYLANVKKMMVEQITFLLSQPQ